MSEETPPPSSRREPPARGEPRAPERSDPIRAAMRPAPVPRELAHAIVTATATAEALARPEPPAHEEIDDRFVAGERSGIRDSWRPTADMPVLGRYGRFDLLGRLDRGGMAEILLARERAMVGGASRYVVIKRVLPHIAADEQFVRMFVEEGRLAMGLSHPNLCHLYDLGCQDGTWFMAMEWVNGVSLRKLVQRAQSRGGLPPAVVARIVASVAEALDHAHNARDASGKPLGLVHRDVSPHNIMVAYDGTVKLLDFGVAKAVSRKATTGGVIKGKLAYMAPEQPRGEPVDARTDLFSLGVCAYEALSGKDLYRRASDFETLRAIVEGPVPSLRAVAPRTPRSLDAIVWRALQKKPDDRFQSARDMQIALEQYLATEREVVTAHRIAQHVRSLFAEEIRRGPDLLPLRASDVVPARLPMPPPLPAAALRRRRVPSLATLRRARRFRYHLLAGAIVAALTGVLLAFLDHAGDREPPARQERTAAVTAVPMRAVPTPRATTEEHRAAEPDAAATEIRRDTSSAERRNPKRNRRLGVVSVNTTPWSRVYWGEQSIGTTPIGTARLPVGSHRLRFVDRDGHTHHRTVRVAAHRETAHFFDLHPTR